MNRIPALAAIPSIVILCFVAACGSGIPHGSDVPEGTVGQQLQIGGAQVTVTTTNNEWRHIANVDIVATQDNVGCPGEGDFYVLTPDHQRQTAFSTDIHCTTLNNTEHATGLVTWVRPHREGEPASDGLTWPGGSQIILAPAGGAPVGRWDVK